jgi:hypothetical protein
MIGIHAVHAPGTLSFLAMRKIGKQISMYMAAKIAIRIAGLNGIVGTAGTALKGTTDGTGGAGAAF